MDWFIGIWVIIISVVGINLCAAGTAAILHAWRSKIRRGGRIMAAAAVAGFLPSSSFLAYGLAQSIWSASVEEPFVVMALAFAVVMVIRLGNVCMICPDARAIHHGGQSDKVRTDKMIRLFRAKSQLFEKHWPGYQLPLGRAMLQTWTLTRLIGTFLLRRPSHQTWREIWRRRREWLS
jgi:hypothetical protein